MARPFLRSILFIIFVLACFVPSPAQRRKGRASRSPARPAAKTPPVVEKIPQAWKEFAPPEGRFTILLPGAPVRDTPVGNGAIYSYGLETSLAIYGAGYLDFPDSGKEAAELSRDLIESTTGSMTQVPSAELVK